MNKIFTRMIALCFSAIIILSCTLNVIAAESKHPSQSSELDFLINKNLETKVQEKYFNEFIISNLKYLSSRSMIGNNGKWLAFVDLYEKYEKSKPTGELFANATVQYGFSKLPSTTTTCTIKFDGKDVHTLTYKNDLAYSFYQIKLEPESKSQSVNFKIQNDFGAVDIALKQEFPNKNIVSYSQALNAMLPEYTSFVTRNGSNNVDHTLIKLKSYIKDIETLKRSYAWEVCLVEKNALPSKATIIRYDCTTKKISIVQREIRDYN